MLGKQLGVQTKLYARQIWAFGGRTGVCTVGKVGMRKQLRALVGTRTKVQLTRMLPSEPRHNGFVLALGREWVLLQQFHDFYPEGYTALRVKDITDIRSGEYERHWEHMLAAEGLDRVTIPDDLSLENVSQLLEALQRRGNNIIVECEDLDEAVKDFYIGQILSVDENSVCFAHFDALGRWDDDPHTIPFKEITKLQFETPYVQTFSSISKVRASEQIAAPDCGGTVLPQEDRGAAIAGLYDGN